MNPFIETLPAGIQAKLASVKPADEEVLVQVASDMDRSGLYGGQWLVVTPKSVFVIPVDGRNGAVRVSLSDLAEARVEELVGAGRLALEQRERATIFVNYSNSLKAKFAEIAGGIQKLSKGEELVLPDEIEKTRCDRCGSLLPEKDGICAACIRKRDTLRRIVRYLLPYRRQVILLMIISAVFPAIGLVPPQIVRHIIDDVLTPGGNVGLLLMLVGGLLGVQIVNWGLDLARGWLRGGLASLTGGDIRSQLYRHIQFMPLRFHDKRQSGTLISRFMNDADRVEMLLLFGIPELVTNGLMVVGILCLLLSMSWQLTLLVLLPVPFILIGSCLIWGRMRGLWGRWHGRWSRLNAHLNESISGIRVVKAFAQEDRESRRFDDRNEGLRSVTVTAERNWFVLFTVMNFLMGFGVFLVWYFGGRQIVNGTFTLGALMAFVSYLWQLYRPFTFLNQLNNFITRAFAGAERVFEVLDARDETVGAEDRVAMPKMEGRVQFTDVRFEYDKGKPVLKGIDLDVAPGEMIGLVGKSGVGKSTLIRLICRFYDPDQGRIEIDGVDIGSVRLEDLRRHIGVVQQEPFLFSGTIAENISYGNPQAKFGNIVRAAMAAEAHEFIVGKPDGYNTPVGEKGGRLAGGEKQRIAIARAILHDPRLLILDEATSCLDTPTEKKIQAAVGRLVQGRTTFAIAHRLSTLRRADRLVVLDDGKIAELGTHEELMAREGVFYRLVQTQRETTAAVAVGGGKDDPNRPLESQEA